MKLELNSTGLILPKELLARLGLQQGDELVVTETPDGIVVRKSDDTFARGMEIAREAMKTYRNTMKELAK